MSSSGHNFEFDFEFDFDFDFDFENDDGTHEHVTDHVTDHVRAHMNCPMDLGPLRIAREREDAHREPVAREARITDSELLRERTDRARAARAAQRGLECRAEWYREREGRGDRDRDRGHGNGHSSPCTRTLRPFPAEARGAEVRALATTPAVVGQNCQNTDRDNDTLAEWIRGEVLRLAREREDAYREAVAREARITDNELLLERTDRARAARAVQRALECRAELDRER
jgi:hypothetical protein